MNDSQLQNPFESPRAVEEEVVSAQLAPEPPRRKKKKLAPTSVVMAMLGGMFLSPLVPVAFLFLGPASVLLAMFTMVLSMLLLTKTRFTWNMGSFYFAMVAVFFFAPIIFPRGGMSSGFLLAIFAGVSLSVTIVILLLLPVSRRYYLERATN